MPDIEFEDEGLPLTPSDVEEAEKGMGIKFPEQFRNLYLQHNGGLPLPNFLEKDGDEFQINEIFRIKYGEKGSRIESCYELVVKDEEGVFPDGLMPFGQDAGGDLFCFRLAGPKEGAICYWRHEQHDHPELAVVELADDLNSFLAVLVMPPDVDGQ